MKLSKLFLVTMSTLIISGVAMAEGLPMVVPAENVTEAAGLPTVDAAQKDGKTIVVSPRTGVRYAITNPNNRPVVFKIEPLAPANTSTVSRIVATNPALSVESQQQAQQALLSLNNQ